MNNGFEVWEIKGKQLVFLEQSHTYIYDGKVLPSITQILQSKFKNMYAGVSKQVLDKAANAGSNMHESIENYERHGIEVDTKELRNYKLLKKHFGWKCLENEIPVVLFENGEPIAAGRLDMIAEYKGVKCVFDLKRTSVLHKEYVALQTNLYRIAYQQCYGEKIEGLGVIHLREDTRKFIPLPINEELTWKVIHEYMKGENI